MASHLLCCMRRRWVRGDEQFSSLISPFPYIPHFNLGSTWNICPESISLCPCCCSYSPREQHLFPGPLKPSPVLSRFLRFPHPAHISQGALLKADVRLNYSPSSRPPMTFYCNIIKPQLYHQGQQLPSWFGPCHPSLFSAPQLQQKAATDTGWGSLDSPGK